MVAREIQPTSTPVAAPQVNVGVSLEEMSLVCNGEFHQRVEQAESTIARLQQNIESHERNLLDCCRQLDVTMTERAALKEKVISTEKAARMLTHLSGLIEAGKYVKFTRDSLGVFMGETTPIVIHHRRRDYHMGIFKVQIATRSGYGAGITFSGGHLVNRCIHPYILGHNPCLGNVSEDMAQFARRGEYSVMMEVAYDFLTSFNGKHPYHDIEGWADFEPERRLQRLADGSTNAWTRTAAIEEEAAVRAENRQVARDARTTEVTSGTLNASGLDERLVNRIRSAGVDPATLTDEEIIRLRQVRGTSTPAVYRRHLNFYTNWIVRRRRTARTRGR